MKNKREKIMSSPQWHIAEIEHYLWSKIQSRAMVGKEFKGDFTVRDIKHLFPTLPKRKLRKIAKCEMESSP